MNSSEIEPLLTKIKFGTYQLKNRVVMASLTRNRADYATSVPNDLHVKYYSERAESAGLIFTECSAISKRGCCFNGVANIYTDEQVEGWKKVTDAVHKSDTRIFLQIWHCGRAALEEILGEKPLSCSNVKNRNPARGPNGPSVYGEPIAMTKEDMKHVLGEFRIGAENAKKAGFDGVELHGGYGYLIDCFLRDCANNRNDEYGGSIENRCRFPLEVVDVLIDVWGCERVGVKLNPVGRWNDMYDSDPVPLFSYFLKELNKRKVLFVELLAGGEFRPCQNLYGVLGEKQIENVFDTFRGCFDGILIANNMISFEEGNRLINEGKADMCSFGRFFIANPDLVERFKNGWELAKPDQTKNYTPGPEGYIDYPKYALDNA
jgi:N-ethylmaleimide reductase